MAASPLLFPLFHAFATTTGLALAGGKVYTYAAGTTTPQTTWTDSTKGTPNANPVVLDSRGEAAIWLDGGYKIVLKDSADVTIWTADNVYGGVLPLSLGGTGAATASAALDSLFGGSLSAAVKAFLLDPSSSKFADAVSGETGTAGGVVFSISPTFTGTPAAPTAAAGTDTTQLATTAYVLQEGEYLQQSSQSAAYPIVLADAGKMILHPLADNNARTFTIPANASVAFPVGTVLTFVNEINTLTIAITSDTLTLAGFGTTGSRTLAASGIATATKVSSTKWIISGVGLT